MPDKISDQKLGFRKKVTTGDCIKKVIGSIETLKENPINNYTIVVSLEIKGAFDHIEWPCIIRALEKKGLHIYITNIVKSYLSDRRITFGEAKKALTRGCPRGGVLSAPLWNLTFDSVLDYLQFNDVLVIHYVYADNTLLIIKAQFRDELIKKISELIRGLGHLGLKRNHEKTDVILFINYPRYLLNDNDWDLDEITISNVTILITKFMKYLGVIIDNRLKFLHHLDYINEKP